MTDNLDTLQKWLVPRRNQYQLMAGILRHDLKIILEEHPESFDVVIFPALDSEQDEVLSVDKPSIGLLDRNERRQTYGEPIQARAHMVQDPELAFEAVDSALFESLVGTEPPVHLLLSVPGIRTFSLIQWLEYLGPDECEPVERTYYVAETKPMGRTLNADVLHVCYPLPALGEIPDIEEEEDGEQVEGEAGGDTGEESGTQSGTAGEEGATADGETGPEETVATLDEELQIGRL